MLKDTRNTLSKEDQRFRGKALKAADYETVDTMQTVLHGVLITRYYNTTLARAGHDVQAAIKKVADMRHPAEWYMEARAQQRMIYLHIGPTNSGKTYHALKELEKARSGFYAGPLRLLAHEVYSRFQAKGMKCNLLTGDDVRMDESDGSEVQRYAATVEMVDTSTIVDVGVIDEIQMMADEDRGWAWTRAFLGAPAKELHLCGEPRVLPLIKEMVGAMGDTLVVKTYDRLNPLKCMDRSLEGDFGQLRKGDAVVAFTIVGIHALKKIIENKTGKRVAIVYGSLPPETRAQQAALFNDPNNDYDYLVASDAIGMGLNLSIKRVIFETVFKFNGLRKEQMSIPQIKQIAGRAGRYRVANQPEEHVKDVKSLPRRLEQEGSVGLVTTLYADHLPILRAAMTSEAPPITVAGILPPGDFIEDLATRLPKETPHAYVLQTLAEAASVHPRYSMCELRNQMKVANIVETVKGLDAQTRHVFTMAPFSFKVEYFARGAALLRELAQYVADRATIDITDLKHMPLEMLEQPLRSDRQYLADLEFLHQALILYRWLGYRVASLLHGAPMAQYAKEMVEAKINTLLEDYSDAKSKKYESVRKVRGQIPPGSYKDRVSVREFARQKRVVGDGHYKLKLHLGPADSEAAADAGGVMMSGNPWARIQRFLLGTSCHQQQQQQPRLVRRQCR
ncbi:ATP-dependent RNA helicase suv3, mitochondrial [Cyphellophora attinorum]|uniref:RNA helicase n=1 Tax=Cyphellophora attinorum TaxID=1664694 RepID=A0A0N1GY67_9EURO|nr:ATP-dependent RNA helicase suv3, mitochondrial [Phialophora attinorum]KPI35497.1 ATP-dependent RNA helicase suv3, mitochondrial [Phialophora attinorum]